MEVETEARDNVLVVRLNGRLDAAEVPTASRAFANIAEQTPDAVLVLNLAGVDFIDSAGLGLVVSVHRKALERDARVAFCAPSPQVRTLLELTRIGRVIAVHESEQEALEQEG